MPHEKSTITVRRSIASSITKRKTLRVRKFRPHHVAMLSYIKSKSRIHCQMLLLWRRLIVTGRASSTGRASHRRTGRRAHCLTGKRRRKSTRGHLEVRRRLSRHHRRRNGSITGHWHTRQWRWRQTTGKLWGKTGCTGHWRRWKRRHAWSSRRRETR
jgi:hypothetical protein